MSCKCCINCPKQNCTTQMTDIEELEDKIKQCDLNMFASSKDKSEPDEEFRTIYLQRCELLRKYREKYGKKAEYQLRDQLDEARKDYVEKYVSDSLRLIRQRALFPETCA